MLVDRGLAKDNSARLYLQEIIPEITASDLDYTVHLFSQLAANVSGYAPGHRLAPAAIVLARRFAEIRREAATRALREVVLDALANGDRRLQETLFLQLLGKREFDLVETAAKQGSQQLKSIRYQLIFALIDSSPRDICVEGIF